jgi:hypothetical protein
MCRAAGSSFIGFVLLFFFAAAPGTALPTGPFKMAEEDSATSPAICAQFPSSADFLLRGRITDRESRAPLAGARVSLIDTRFAAVAGEDGSYLLSAVPAGDYQCLIEKDGYLPLVTRVRAAGAAREIVISAALEVLRSEITVVAKEAERPETIASSRLSLTGMEVRKLPGTFEDVSRALQSVPGVASAGDFRNDLIVRGGSPAENLFMLEWIQLPGLSHFGSQNSSGGGYFGLLDSRLIKTIDFYSGGFPAAYGDKLSSITRVVLREGNRSRFSGSAYFSLLGLSGSAEGPLFGGKGSWLATVRKDYFFAVPKDMTMELTVMPELFDAQAKAVLDLSKRLQLSVLGLAGSDSIRIEESDEPPARRMTIDFKDHTYVGGATLKWLLGGSGVVYFSLSRTDSRNIYTEWNNSQERYTTRSDGKETGARADLEIFPLAGLQVMAGLSCRRVEAGDHIYFRGGYVMIDRMGFTYTKKNTDIGLDSNKWAAYLQTSYPLTPRLKATAGVRADRFDAVGKTAVSPRFGLSYELRTGMTVRASLGIYHQAPETFWINCDPSNRSLSYLRTENVSFGFTSVVRSDIRMTAEVFGKNYHNYPVDTYNPYQTLANLGGSVIPTYFGSPLVSKGKGFARGAELSVQKLRTGRWSWSASYSYSTVKFQALDGVLRPGDFDYRHLANALVSYRISPSWDVSVRWRLSGGQPYTPFDMKQSIQRDWTYYDLAKINTLRYPAYHRLDLRIDKSFVFKKWTLEAYLDIQNVYDRKNVYYKFWNDAAEHTVYYLPLIPFIGIQAGF